MTITIEQIEGTIRTYEKALKENPLSEKEKQECLKKIKQLELMKEKLK